MATVTYGTNRIADLLATADAASALDMVGDIAEGVQQLLAAHNRITNDMFGDYVAGTTSEAVLPWGGIGEMDLTEIDEMGTPEAQKVAGGEAIGLPLKKWGRGLQWTYAFLERATAADYIKDTRALMVGDVKNIKYQFLTALFRPTNYNFVDKWANRVTLPVKALVNGDSMAIPVAADGTSFDASTHTHYLGSATLTAAALIGLGDTVAEHHTTGQTIIDIPRASEATVRAMTGANEFVPYPNPSITYADSTVLARGRTLDIRQTYDREIGVIGPSSYVVRVKPWVPANYAAAFQTGVPKPIYRRIDSKVPASQDLRPAFEGDIHPLVCKVMERMFGFGVVNRTNAAVLKTNNVTYSAPVLTL